MGSDKTVSEGNRVPFLRQMVITDQVLLVSPTNRWAIVIVNEGPDTLLVGHSGTPVTHWTGIPNGASLTDDFSHEDWYVRADTSSGTVSGFSVV